MTKDRPTISISIENTDLSATLTEYAQENANLRLSQKALMRKINEQQAEIATLKKANEKDEDAGSNGTSAAPVPAKVGA